MYIIKPQGGIETEQGAAEFWTLMKASLNAIFPSLYKCIIAD